MLYLPIAETATLGTSGELDARRIRKLLDPSVKGPVNTWRKHQPEILAYALWRIHQHSTAVGNDLPAERALEMAMAMNLHTIEPRLTELACQRLVDDGDPDKAFTIAEAVLAQRTTDSAYRDLSDWVQYTKNALYAQAPPPRRPITYPRMARPDNHHHPRRYS